MPDGRILGTGGNGGLLIRTLDSEWQVVSNEPPANQIAALADGSIMGLNDDFKLIRRADLHSNWELVPNRDESPSVLAGVRFPLAE